MVTAAPAIRSSTSECSYYLSVFMLFILESVTVLHLLLPKLNAENIRANIGMLVAYYYLYNYFD